VSKHLEEIGVSNERIRVLYPPVDMRLYKPLEKKWARSKLDLPIEAKIVVYIGGLKRTRFPEETMLEIMKELWKEIPEVILLVCTSRDIENLERALEISRKIKAANLSRRILIWARNLTDFEKTMIYNAADLFLLPHFGVKTAIEPPLTVLEAMACGTTVLVPETPSLSEIVADSKNGFVFRVSDYNALLKKLESALTCRKLKARMAYDARHTIDQKASLLTTGAKMIEFFESVIS
jgi:glycosyltransferase involved in cell wall biosynthesis